MDKDIIIYRERTNYPQGISGARAGVLDGDGLGAGVPEEEISNGKAQDDRDKDAAVVGHDREHEEVSDGGVDAEEEGGGESGGVSCVGGEERSGDGGGR